MTDLFPCPFCGSKVAMSVLEDRPGDIICAWVDCTCGAATNERRTEEEAAERWNTRAHLPGPPQEAPEAQQMRGLREALIAAKCTSPDGTFVHASMEDILRCAQPLAAPAETATERFQKRIVEMLQVGCTGFQLSTGDDWHSLDIEEKCAALLDMWDAEKVETVSAETKQENAPTVAQAAPDTFLEALRLELIITRPTEMRSWASISGAVQRTFAAQLSAAWQLGLDFAIKWFENEEKMHLKLEEQHTDAFSKELCGEIAATIHNSLLDMKRSAQKKRLADG